MILDDIVAHKRRELQQRVPLGRLEEMMAQRAPPLNFAGSLWGGDSRVIAEVKKASPSRGVLRKGLDPVALAMAYAENGAAAVSVLTDGRFFQGSLEDMGLVKEALGGQGIPVLRKDFIIDPYQVHQARAYGADAILLIVAILSPQELRELLTLSRGFWMQCLVEVHTQEELWVALDCGAEAIGINHRDLRTFETDLFLTERLRPLIPNGKVVVSESGIKNREDVVRLQKAGADAVLVGETLVTDADPGAKLRELLGQPVAVAPGGGQGQP